MGIDKLGHALEQRRLQCSECEREMPADNPGMTHKAADDCACVERLTIAGVVYHASKCSRYPKVPTFVRSKEWPSPADNPGAVGRLREALGKALICEEQRGWPGDARVEVKTIDLSRILALLDECERAMTDVDDFRQAPASVEKALATLRREGVGRGWRSER